MTRQACRPRRTDSADRIDGRAWLESALKLQTEAARTWPASAVAWHNLAATLADLGRLAEAREAVETALSRGSDAPESWLIYGNILLAQHDPASAEAAYRQALARRPAYVDAAVRVSQLAWMRRGQWAGAAEPLTQALRAGAEPVGMLLTYARLLETDGWSEELGQLHRELDTRYPDDARVFRVLAERALLDGELDRALARAEQAVALSPRFVGARAILTAVRLARGEHVEAMIAARAAIEVDPLDQSTWGWLGTAARAAGDPLYGKLCDYGALVGTYRLPTPPGWGSLETFLSDLQEVLLRRHSLPHPPYDQSVRGGSQTPADLVRRSGASRLLRNRDAPCVGPRSAAPSRARAHSGAEHGARPPLFGVVGPPGQRRPPYRPFSPSRLAIVGLLRLRAADRGRRGSGRLASVRPSALPDPTRDGGGTLRASRAGSARAVSVLPVARHRAVHLRPGEAHHRL